MIDERLQPLVSLIKKGLEKGFSGSYIIHQLTKKGYSGRQLEHAFQLATMQPQDTVETQVIDPKHMQAVPQEEPQTHYHEVAYTAEHEHAKSESFRLFKDPASFI